MRRTIHIALAPFIALAACTTNATPQPEPAPVLPSCVPNRDGMITADELPIALGATVTYYTGTNRTIAQTGTAWKLDDELPDDDVIELGPVALGAQWYAASFPSGQFVVDAGSGLDGIYHQDAQALWLDGTASHDESPAGGKTLVVYAPPVAVLRFPVTKGQSFSTTTTLVDATINGLPFNGTDELTVDVAESGTLRVPYVEFSPVLRVRTHATRRASSGGVPAVGRRTTIFLFECFGEVTRAESKQDETNPDFTTAAYLRRFALGVTP
ncbi:MAG: hypothetical protein HOV81_42465 [Kofleriaceae bacterium]|nr:hypothetical protein [Kofleriaceae bacterium]